MKYRLEKLEEKVEKLENDVSTMGIIIMILIFVLIIFGFWTIISIDVLHVIIDLWH